MITSKGVVRFGLFYSPSVKERCLMFLTSTLEYQYVPVLACLAFTVLRIGAIKDKLQRS